MTPSFDVSIIVSTRNRAGSLKRLLESLDSLEHADSVRVEVLVVNNGSTDETAELLAGEQTKNHGFAFRVAEEPQKGRSRSHNRGLFLASFKILCLLDDDVVVDKKWLENLLAAYGHTSFSAIQARVLPGVDPRGRTADPKKLREYNIPIVDYGDEIREIRGLTGACMSFKRAVFEKVGFFDIRLGPGASGFSDDTEYSMRIRKAGFKVGYTPHAIVYHELNPDRYGRDYNRAVQYRKGVSRSVYRRDSIAFNILPNLFVNCIRFGLYRAMGKRQKTYKTEGRIVKYWGYFLGRMKKIF